ncbi:hypothetical protein EPN96_00855 [bacterium]|nr:MAG: hypothetical protein EPN96_00855 [bacterium]
MKRTLKALLAGAVMLAPMAGWAAIDGTHHDMTVYPGGAGTSTQKCAYCHSITLPSVATPGLGTVGVFCALVCHDATRIANAAVDAPGFITPADLTTTVGGSGLAVLTASHGLMKANIVNYGNLDTVAAVTGTNWPHAGEASMQCTTCHAVHDGTNPPFLNAPLATGDNTTAFCNRCHTGANAGALAVAGRWQNIANQGAHPTEFVYSATGDAYAAAPGKSGRSISFKAPLVNTVAAQLTVPLFNNASNDAWVTGGHLIDTVANMPKTAVGANATTRFGCYSCHSAHQNDGALAATLTLGATNAAHVGGASSVICISCHGAGAANTVIWNVGDTNFGHPANEAAAQPYEHDHASHGNVHPNIPSAGTFPLDVVNPVGGISGADNLTAVHVGANQEILCETCHDVHGGVVGQMAIRQIGTVDTATELICRACHGTNPQPAGGAGINRHHPTVALAGIDPGYNTAAALAWDAQYGNAGNMTMADGLGCADCHAFGNTAHNW